MSSSAFYHKTNTEDLHIKVLDRMFGAIPIQDTQLKLRKDQGAENTVLKFLNEFATAHGKKRDKKGEFTTAAGHVIQTSTLKHLFKHIATQPDIAVVQPG